MRCSRRARPGGDPLDRARSSVEPGEALHALGTDGSYVGGIILACGMVGFTAAQGYEILLFDLTQEGRFDLADLADASDGIAAPGIAMLVLFLPGAVVGLLTMAVALWRSRAVPRWAVLLIPAFIILDIPLQRGLAAHAVAFVAACWIAWAAVVRAGRLGYPDSAAST